MNNDEKKRPGCAEKGIRAVGRCIHKGNQIMGKDKLNERQEIKCRLQKKIEEYTEKMTVIAFTGEIKSRILLKAASQLPESKRSRILAVTVNGCLRPRVEIELAKREAVAFGMNHYIFDMDELRNGQIRSNSSDRCGQCRRYLFKNIEKLCRPLKTEQVLWGVDFDDWKEEGIRQIAEEFHLCAPLATLGISRRELAGLAQEFSLPFYSVFSKDCYTTRFPEGTILTLEKLNQAEQGENFLRSLNIWDIKIKIVENDIWLSAGNQGILKMVAHREEIVEYLRNLGYERVVIDLVP